MNDETESTGLERAREIMGQADGIPVTEESVASILARTAKAQAIATIELATATQQIADELRYARTDAAGR